MSQATLKLLNLIEKTIVDLEPVIKKRRLKETRSGVQNLRNFSELVKELVPEDFVKDNFEDLDRHLHFMEHFLKKRDFEWIQSNFDDIKERDFPSIKSKINSLAEVEKSPRRKLALSKKVFIVHGRDHTPMKELKTMLLEFGLKPIVLHEEASGGLTLAEKLEKHSRDVGYAFAILTPDDIGCQEADLIKAFNLEGPFLSRNVYLLPAEVMQLQKRLKRRARQNVIFEMGYFWGLLERKRVCCLLKGNVEKPSDIEGIVFVHFKDSIEEIQVKIMRELKEAGYEIKL
jgi:predicted nucleotide-binding protein